VWLRKTAPQLAVRTEVGFPQDLLDKVAAGVLDVAIVYAPQHGLAFPELSNAAVQAGLGPLGREYLLAAGGTGYFQLDVVRGHLASGQLRRVPHTPEFLYPAYAVYAVGADPAIVEPALAGLREVVSTVSKSAAGSPQAASFPGN